MSNDCQMIFFSTFAPIKDQTHLSVEASAAYSNIKQAIENAAEASQKAKNASDITYAEVKPNKF